MKRIASLIILTLLIATFAGTAHAGSDYDNRDAVLSDRNIGGVLGAVGGGVLGSKMGRGQGKTATTIAGTVVGLGLGGYIGNVMDENNRMRSSY